MTVDELLDVVTPALREILTPEELAATTTRVSYAGDSMRPPRERRELTGRDTLGPETLLEVHTLGEVKGIWVEGHDPDATALFERVRSDLQDFVAESRFGWGQLRP